MKDLAQSLGRVCVIGPNSNIDVKVQAHLNRVSFACVSPTGTASVFSFGRAPRAPLVRAMNSTPVLPPVKAARFLQQLFDSGGRRISDWGCLVLETHQKVNYKGVATLHDIGDSAVPSASTYMPEDGESTTGTPPRTLGTEISHHTFFGERVL